MSSYLTLDPLGLITSIEQMERERLDAAGRELDSSVQRHQFDTPMMQALSTDRRELAAQAMARAAGVGPSMSGMQAREASMQVEAQQVGAGSLGEAAGLARQASGQQARIAMQGAQAQQQESAQQLGFGLNQLAADAHFQLAGQMKNQELAQALAIMHLSNAGRATMREANLKSAEVGIQADEYMTNLQNRDRRRGQLMATGLTALGTVANAAAQSPAAAATAPAPSAAPSPQAAPSGFMGPSRTAIMSGT